MFGCLTAADWTTFNNKLSSSLTKGYFLVGSDAGVAQATSSIFVSSTGKVGIGTSTPDYELQVVQSDGSLADFAVNRYGGGGIWLTGDSGNGYVSSFKSGGNLFLRTGGGSKNAISMIDSTGYVGIGTSSPSSLLSVHGGAYISSGLFVGGNIVSTSTTASILPYASTTALSVSGTAYIGSLTGTLQAVSGEVSASSTLSVAYGGTGATTFTSNGLLYGNARGAIQATAAGTGGQILMASGTGIPTWIATSTMPFIGTSLASANIIVGNGSGVATAVAMSGDVSITNGGVTAVADDSHNHVITNIDAFTSLALATQLTDETGTGLATFSFDPTIIRPTFGNGITLGTSSAATFVITSALSGATDPTLTFGNDLITSSGDFKITGDNLYMNTNTSGAILVANGTSFAPVVMSGDASVATNGTVTIASSITRDTEWDTWAEHPAIASTNILVGNASNQAAAVAMSGDASISNAGALTISDNSVDGTDIALGSDATGDLMYYNGTDWARRAIGANGQILSISGGVPTWTSTSSLLTSLALTKGNFLVGSDEGTAQATSSIFVSSTGNVGIGTTNPTYKLDVSGDINLTGRVRVSGGQALYVPGGNFTGTMYLGDGGGSLSYSSGSDGRYNTAVGIGALYANTTGNYNTANGVNALYSNTTGYSNTANGMSALYSNTTGYANTANGVNALFSNTTGYFNTAEGYLAGRYIADGSTANQTSYNSLYIGANTRALADGDTNEVVIGYGAIGNGSNSVTLGNTSISKTILQGNVGIGDTTPSSLLTVGTGDAFRVGSDGQASTTSRVTAQKGFSVSGVDAYASVNNAPVYGIGYSDLAIDGAAYNATQMSGYYGLSFVTGSVSGSAVPRMVVTQSGKVGIGTTTPLMNLDVYAASSTGYIARIFNSNTGNTSKGLLIQLGQTGYGQTGNVYVGFATSTAAGAPSLAGKITGNGSGITLYTGNADFAEYFRVSNPSEKPKRGELVSAAEGEAETVSRAMPGSVPLGIVSTSPGFIGNSPMCKPSDLNCEENIERYNVVVAMAGRVPTKVNMDGGAIKPGDRITLSTMPGVGAKATTSGVVVGIALDTFDADSEKDGDGVGMIKVLINLSYYKIDPEIKAGEVLANLWTLNESTGSIRAMGPVDFDNYPILNVKAIQSFSGKWSIDEDGSIVAEDLKVKGSATLGSPENRIGVTLYDEVSGAPYCLRISNGSVKTSPGECGNTSSDTSSGSSDDGQSTPPPSDTSTPPAEEGTGTGITPPSDATEETSPVTDPEPGSPSDEPTPEPAPTPDPVSEPTPEVTPIPESAPGETTTP